MNKDKYKRREIKRKSLITKSKYPMSIAWHVDEGGYDKFLRSGQLQIFQFGEQDKISFYGYACKSGTKDIELLIKELTDFVNIIKKGK